jgi:hypothetical protein
VPSKFGKVDIQLVASYIGLDNHVELAGNQPVHGTTAMHPKPSKVRGNATAKSSVPKQRQTSIQESLKKIRPDRVKDIQAARKRKLDASSTSNIAVASLETRNRADVDRGSQVEENESRPSVPPTHITQSPKPVSKTLENFFLTPESNMNRHQQNHDFTWNRDESQGQFVEYQSLESFPPRGTQQEIPRQQYSGIAFQQPNSSFPHPQPTNRYQSTPLLMPTTPDNRNIVRGKNPLSASERKDRGSWNDTKRKHQRVQQRAFTQKSDNPFSTFQHDPNDAENFLEINSAKQSVERSIIPSKELDALRRRSETERRHISSQNNSNYSSRNIRGRRSSKFEQEPSTRQLLQMKAEEHQSYAFMGGPARNRQAGPGFTPTHDRHYLPPQEQVHPQNRFDQGESMYGYHQMEGQEAWEASRGQFHGSQFQNSNDFSLQQPSHEWENNGYQFSQTASQCPPTSNYQHVGHDFLQADQMYVDEPSYHQAGNGMTELNRFWN